MSNTSDWDSKGSLSTGSITSDLDVDEGKVTLKNPNLMDMAEDVLYHFALGTKTHDLKAMFGDVKFVVVGGSPRRMEKFANYMLQELNYGLPTGQALINIAGATDRYAMYKVGPVLSVSHGMGAGSFLIMMNELIKLLYYAQACDVTCFRTGTCGGLGLHPGTVVISESTVDAMFQEELQMPILGKMVSRPAVLDKELAKELQQCCEPSEDGFEAVVGKTMCTMDFYEGQGRLDGAFCDYTEEDKMTFLKLAHQKGVRNIEMESLCFAAMCHHANIRGAVACVSLLDRFQGDQVNTPHHILKQWEDRPSLLLSRFIRKKLGF